MNQITNPKSQRRWWRRFAGLWPMIVEQERWENYMASAGFYPVHVFRPVIERSRLDWNP